MAGMHRILDQTGSRKTVSFKLFKTIVTPNINNVAVIKIRQPQGYY